MMASNSWVFLIDEGERETEREKEKSGERREVVLSGETLGPHF
jgi:hypothetical protein